MDSWLVCEIGLHILQCVSLVHTYMCAYVCVCAMVSVWYVINAHHQITRDPVVHVPLLLSNNPLKFASYSTHSELVTCKSMYTVRGTSVHVKYTYIVHA